MFAGGPQEQSPPPRAGFLKPKTVSCDKIFSAVPRPPPSRFQNNAVMPSVVITALANHASTPSPAGDHVPTATRSSNNSEGPSISHTTLSSGLSQKDFQRLKWRVLLHQGEAKNSMGAALTVKHGDSDVCVAMGASSSDKGHTNNNSNSSAGSSGVMWSSAICISPRSQHRNEEPKATTTTCHSSGADVPTARPLSAKQRPTSAKTTTTTGGLQVHAHGGSFVNGRYVPKVTPTSATFSKSRGLLLQPTLMIPIAEVMDMQNNQKHNSPTAAAHREEELITQSNDGDKEVATPVGPVATQLLRARPTSAPSKRDMDHVKKLIRLVKIETGETHFRNGIDTRVVQSLIPTASNRGNPSPRRDAAGEATETTKKNNRPMSANVALSRAREAHLTKMSVVGTDADFSKGLDFKESAKKMSSAAASTAASPNGKDELQDAAQKGASINKPTSYPSRGARVSYKPTFSYHRSYDGHATLEGWEQNTDSPRFFHFSADTIPVVGRH